MRSKIAVFGGAGFLGRHLINGLANVDVAETILVFDKFIHQYPKHSYDSLTKLGCQVFKLDLSETKVIQSHLESHGIDTVIHLAANADISKATSDPTIDFYQGTLLTQYALEIARKSGVGKFIFTSGSGVYGDDESSCFDEKSPYGMSVSPYSASKISSEVLLQTYSNMFGIQTTVFRMGNIVGSFQTHGVGIDFLQKLWQDQSVLQVLGNGRQQKPYIYVQDVVEGIVKLSLQRTSAERYEVFNLATEDGTLVREIAELAVSIAGRSTTRIVYGKTSWGWPGDVPRISMSSTKARSFGWLPTYNSREAVEKSLLELASQRLYYNSDSWREAKLESE